MTTPALPEGFTLDAEEPPLPEGFTVDGAGGPAASVAPAPVSSVMDFFNGLKRGAARALASTASASGTSAATEMGQPDAGIPDDKQAFDALQKNVTGDLGTAQGAGGRFGDAIGETLANPASWIGPGGVAMKALTGTGAAIGSEALGGMVDPTSKWAPILRLAGAFAGGHVPAVGARVITPLPAAAERLGLVKTLKDEGVPVSAGDKTGRVGLRYWENDLQPNRNEDQAEAFTRAALSRAGISADRATPDVMDNAFSRIGGDFDALEARNTFKPDQQFGQKLNSVLSDYESNVPPSARAPGVKNISDDIFNGLAQGNGTMTGEAYQKLRSRLRTMARGTKDPDLSSAYHGLGNALDDAFERGIAGTPDTGAFGEARRQYRNMLVLERAAGAAGEGPAQGLISPAQLASATKAVQGKRAFVRGQGDFADLARAGQGILKPLPDSGTSWRNRVNNTIRLAGGALGATFGPGHGVDPVYGLLLGELAAEPALRFGMKHAVMNRGTQWYLGNQALPSVPGLLSTAPGQLYSATAR